MLRSAGTSICSVRRKQLSLQERLDFLCQISWVFWTGLNFLKKILILISYFFYCGKKHITKISILTVFKHTAQ